MNSIINKVMKTTKSAARMLCFDTDLYLLDSTL